MKNNEKKDIVINSVEEIANIKHLIISHQLKSLTINYQFDNTTELFDSLSSIDENNNVSFNDQDNVPNFQSPFSGINLTNADFDIIIGPKCTSLRGLFAGQIHLKTIKSLQQTSKVTNFNYAFFDCCHLTAIPEFNTDSAITMIGTFAHCKNLESSPIAKAEKLINCSMLFQNCKNLINVPSLNFPLCKDCSFSFENCYALKNPFPFLLPSLINAHQMFSNCISLEFSPLMHCPNINNLVLMFENCKNLKAIPAFIFDKLKDSKIQIPALGCFVNCTSITDDDQKFLLEKCCDTLFSLKMATTLDPQYKKQYTQAVDNSSEIYKTIIRYFSFSLMTVLIVLIVNFTIRSITINNEQNNSNNSSENKTIENIIIPTETVKKELVELDKDEIELVYTNRCKNEHIKYESFMKLLLDTQVAIGRYTSFFVKNDNNETRLILANKDSIYVSDAIELIPNNEFELDKKINLLVQKIEKSDLESYGSQVAKIELTEYSQQLNHLTPTISNYEYFIYDTTTNNGAYELFRKKFLKTNAIIGNDIYYQYTDNIKIIETASNRVLIPLLEYGYLFYLDQNGQITDEHTESCFEIPENLLKNLKLRLTLDQSKVL